MLKMYRFVGNTPAKIYYVTEIEVLKLLDNRFINLLN
jgi:hypothetical protein